MNNSETTPSSQRTAALDVAKVVLAFFVLALHCNLLQDIYPLAGDMLVNGLFRIAVPFFFVANGYFLPEDHVSRRKWFLRVTVLYVVWMLIYAPLWLANIDGSSSTLTIMAKAFKVWVFGYHHLWYLVAMLAGGLLIFLFSALKSSTVTYVAAALFLAGVAIQYLGSYSVFHGKLGELLTYNWVHRNAVFTAFPFMWVGLLIKQSSIGGLSVRTQSEIVARKRGVTVAAAAMLGVLLEALLNAVTGASTKGFDNLLSMGPAAASLFFIAVTIKLPLSRTKVIATLATAIYLLHPYLLLLTESLYPFTPSPLTFIITALTTTFLSWIFVLLNRKLRWLL